MLDAITQVPAPYNEPAHSFATGSSERTVLEARLKQLAAERAELTMTIGGEQRLGGGEPIDAVQPHRDRRQSADRPGADGQRRAVEAGPDPTTVRPLPDAAAGDRWAAARRDQHGDRGWARSERGGAGPS